MDFIKEMRRKNESKNNKTNEEEEDLTSTQMMIEDSRARRTLTTQKMNQFECEVCPHKTGSKNLMKKHIKIYHQSTYAQHCEKDNHEAGKVIEKVATNEISIQDEVLDSNPGTETIEERAPSPKTKKDKKVPTGGKKKTGKYVSKRITCEQCDQRFNKEETYNKHIKKYHVGDEGKLMNNSIQTQKTLPFLSID